MYRVLLAVTIQVTCLVANCALHVASCCDGTPRVESSTCCSLTRQQRNQTFNAWPFSTGGTVVDSSKKLAIQAFPFGKPTSTPSCLQRQSAPADSASILCTYLSTKAHVLPCAVATRRPCTPGQCGIQIWSLASRRYPRGSPVTK